MQSTKPPKNMIRTIGLIVCCVIALCCSAAYCDNGNFPPDIPPNFPPRNHTGL